MSRREELEGWNLFKVVELASSHVAGELEKRILRTRWVDTRKVATDGSKEPKSRYSSTGRLRREKFTFREICANCFKAACIIK